MYLSRLRQGGIQLDRNTAVPVWVCRIAKSLAEKMGGTLSFVSRQGVGTTFTLIAAVPHLPCTGEAEQAETPAADRSSIAGLHVLVAEDNRMNMEIAEFVLNVEEAFIIKAVNGEEAVRILPIPGREKLMRF